MNDSLPPKMLFDLSVNSGNYTLNQLQLQQHIAKQEVRIAQSGYLPNIALFGKQTLYSHGIQSNLLPRTMVGIGLHGTSLTDWIVKKSAAIEINGTNSGFRPDEGS